MCVVSMVTDHYMLRWPMMPPPPPAIYPGTQVAPFVVPAVTITREQWDEYQALKRKAAEYDQRTGQPDCEKPGVSEWEKRVEEILIERGPLAKGD